MQGWKLLIVQLYGVDGRTPDGEPVIAVDTLGAGRGERVLLSSDGTQHPGTAQERHHAGPLERDGNSKTMTTSTERWQTPTAKSSDARRIDANVDRCRSWREVAATAHRPPSDRSNKRSAAEPAPAQLVARASRWSVWSTLADRLIGRAGGWWCRAECGPDAGRRDDLLEQHNITVSRSADAIGAAKPALGCWASADTCVRSGRAGATARAAGLGIERLAQTGLATVDCRADRRRWLRTDALGLLLSGKPDVGLLPGQSSAGVRAAVARRSGRSCAGRRAIWGRICWSSIRRGGSLFQLGQMVKQFLQAGSAQCPAALKEQLG